MASSKSAVCVALLALVGCGSSGGGAGGSGTGSGASSGAGGAESGDSGSSGVGSTGVGSTGVGGSGSAGSSGAFAGVEISWDDNGSPRSAAYAEAIRNMSANSDSLEIVGVNVTGTGITIALSSPMTLDGMYTCATTPGNDVELTYGAALVQSCSLTVGYVSGGDGGLAAKGTFSAVLTSSDGGIDNLMNGQFDIPVTNEN